MAEFADNVDLEASRISTYYSFGRKLRSSGKFTSSLLHNHPDGTFQQSFDDDDLDGIEEDERFVRSSPRQTESEEFSGTIQPEFDNSVQDLEELQRRQRMAQNPKRLVNDPTASKYAGSVLQKNIFPNPGKEFDIYKKLYPKHIYKSHQNLQSETPELFPCTICRKQFKEKRQCDYHEYKHRDQAMHSEHRGVHKTKCSIKCYFCNKTFSMKYYLNEHLKTHTGEKYFKCEICPKDFGRKGNLKIHVENVHEGLRPHACPSCPMEFSRKNGLKRHVASVHEGLRPHACPSCPKEFGRKSDLKKHVEIVHEGLRPHACPSCPKEFGQKVSLVWHLYSVHPKSDQSKK